MTKFDPSKRYADELPRSRDITRVNQSTCPSNFSPSHRLRYFKREQPYLKENKPVEQAHGKISSGMNNSRFISTVDEILPNEINGFENELNLA